MGLRAGGYVEGKELPLKVNHDGSAISNMQETLIAVMDTLIAQKRLPMMAAVFIANGSGAGNGGEQSGYDTVSGKYAEFIEAEVLPLAEKSGGVKFTKDPDGRGVVGASSGGAAAMSMAWFHPDLYRRVISYSGTFVGLARSSIAPHGAWEYHENFIPQTEKKPIRIWLEVGSHDLARPLRRGVPAIGRSPTTAWPKFWPRRDMTINTCGRKMPDTSRREWSGRRWAKQWNGCGKPMRPGESPSRGHRFLENFTLFAEPDVSRVVAGNFLSVEPRAAVGGHGSLDRMPLPYDSLAIVTVKMAKSSLPVHRSFLSFVKSRMYNG